MPARRAPAPPRRDAATRAARIMKGNLPDNAKISKDAKEIVQECVSEFISFVTSEASDKCAGASRRRRLQFTERAATTRRAGDKRKTINGGDVLTALQSLGFDRYDEPLRIFLEKYREKVKLEPDATSARAKRARKVRAGRRARALETLVAANPAPLRRTTTPRPPATPPQ